MINEIARQLGTMTAAQMIHGGVLMLLALGFTPRDALLYIEARELSEARAAEHSPDPLPAPAATTDVRMMLREALMLGVEIGRLERGGQA